MEPANSHVTLRHASRVGPRRLRCAEITGLALLSLSLFGLFGCAGGPAEIQLTGFHDPHFPDDHRVVFPAWTYRTEAGGDLHITARADDVKLDPADAPMTHSIDIHLVWRPRPGHTPAPTSGIDATIRYLVTMPDAHVLYVGTGFVYVEKESFGDGISVALERSELHRVDQFGKIDLELSPLRLIAKLTARNAPNESVTVQRDMDRTWSGQIAKSP